MSLLLTWGLKFSHGTTVVSTDESLERRTLNSADAHVRESQLNTTLGRTMPGRLAIEQVDAGRSSLVQKARSGPCIPARPVVIGEER